MREFDTHKAIARLGNIEVFIGCIVGLLSISSTIGSWYVLPYRIKAQEYLTEKYKTETDGRLHDLMQEQGKNREVLIRIDERLRNMQRALKINDPNSNP